MKQYIVFQSSVISGQIEQYAAVFSSKRRALECYQYLIDNIKGTVNLGTVFDEDYEVEDSQSLSAYDEDGNRSYKVAIKSI